MKQVLSVIAMWLLASVGLLSAQVVETRPSPLQQSSKDVVIVFHADRGNKGLKGVTSGVYAHTGVITNKSNGQWAYAPTWGDNADKYALENAGTDLWELKIGDIRSYYGITDPDEIVEKIALVFRSADKSKEGKSENGGDIFVDVHDDAFTIEMACDQPKVMLAPGKVNVTVNATAEADIELMVGQDIVASKRGVTTLSAEVALSSYGNYNIKAVAKSGDETVEKSMLFLVAAESEYVDYPGGIPTMGVVDEGNSILTFCIAAPGKENVILVGSWDDYEPLSYRVMNHCDYDGQRYFWIQVDGFESSKDYMYYYLVDGTTKVADPYSHLILDPYSDKWLDNSNGLWPDYPYERFDDTVLSVWRSDLDDYKWEYNDKYQIPEHDSMVIYELLIRDFTGKDREADGTAAGVKSHLNYLANLGVNVIELLPIMEFNGNNSWGYNTNFYMAPDKAYGSPDQLKELIDLIHGHGMAVVLDIVFNQSDGLHPWYQMYPIKENPFYNANAPHDYNVLNDWKQDHPLVEKQWEDALRYWMTVYNVDGFRFDLVKGLGDNDSYSGGTEAYNASRVERMKRLHAVITDVKADGIHINENLAGPKEENEMAQDGQLNWSNMNNASCQVAMGYKSDSNTAGFYAPLNGGRIAGSTVSYAESHDEERMAYKQTKWGASDNVKNRGYQRARRLGSVAALMLTTPGSHMIWQFGELGADQTTKNSDGSNNTDPKNVLWSRLYNDEWTGLLQSYTELIWMRRNNPEMFGSDATLTHDFNGWENGRFIRLVNGDKEIVLMVNPMEESSLNVSAEVSKISQSNMQVLSASHRFEPSVSIADGHVSCEIPAGAYVVVATGDLTSNDTIGEDIAGGTSATVAGAEGRIVISGDYSSAVAYNLEGRMTGLDNLVPGLYIVVVDGVSSKVIVR